VCLLRLWLPFLLQLWGFLGIVFWLASALYYPFFIEVVLSLLRTRWHVSWKEVYLVFFTCVSCMLLVWQNVPENNLDRLPQWWGPSGAAAAPNILCFVELEKPLLHPAPLLQQTSFHSVHFFCSQINTITNDPSKVTCWNKEETTICHFKLDCFINNFSFGTRFTSELKRVPQLCYSNETKKKKKHINSGPIA
jgi:hypothetical protein